MSRGGGPSTGSVQPGDALDAWSEAYAAGDDEAYESELIVRACLDLEHWLHLHTSERARSTNAVLRLLLQAQFAMVSTSLNEENKVNIINGISAGYQELLRQEKRNDMLLFMTWDTYLRVWPAHPQTTGRLRAALIDALRELVPLCRYKTARIGLIDGLALLSSSKAIELVEQLRSLKPRYVDVAVVADYAVARIHAGGGSNFLPVPGEKR